MSGTPEDLVLAAGGVVIKWHEKKSGARRQRVAVVHRPRGDWSFPKGKLEEGESLTECAEREVLEETGYECELGQELPVVLYTDRHGRPKQVHYWLMSVIRGEFQPNSETDELRWLSAKRAAELLTYETDRELLASALDHSAKDGKNQ